MVTEALGAYTVIGPSSSVGAGGLGGNAPALTTRRTARRAGHVPTVPKATFVVRPAPGRPLMTPRPRATSGR